MWLHSLMMTLNYCTSPIASSCHRTEPAGLWKNSQKALASCISGNRVTHSGFFELSTSIFIQAATIVLWRVMQTFNVCDNIVQYSYALHNFHVYVYFCFNGFDQNPPLWITNSKSAFYNTLCMRESVIKYFFTSV